MSNIDVGNVDDVRAAYASVMSKEGRIDYVIDTASVLYKEPLVHMDYNHIADAIDINYRGMVNVAKEAFAYLEKATDNWFSIHQVLIQEDVWITVFTLQQNVQQ